MSAPFVTLPISVPATGLIKKKRVLLVDVSAKQRDLRADSMRKLGVEVDCAADIDEARLWWRASLYDLVLINMESELGNRDKFCEDLRSATPPQQLAFLVGGPEYLSDFPITDEVALLQREAAQAVLDAAAALPTGVSVRLPIRWGILAASRQISAVRSAYAARSKAMGERPVPVRDLEKRYSRQLSAESAFALPELQTGQSVALPEILREEIQ